LRDVGDSHKSSEETTKVHDDEAENFLWGGCGTSVVGVVRPPLVVKPPREKEKPVDAVVNPRVFKPRELGQKVEPEVPKPRVLLRTVTHVSAMVMPPCDISVSRLAGGATFGSLLGEANIFDIHGGSFECPCEALAFTEVS